jgi:phosphohistidine phosphatase
VCEHRGMPELLVMRHAKSDWGSGLPDFERPLSERGNDDAPRMAQWLEDEGLVPDAVLTSSANRTRTTAHYVVEQFELTDGVVDERPALYHAGADTWTNVLRGLPGQTPRSQPPQRLLICGHNPGLDDLVEYLAGETPELTSNGKLMTTAAIAVFTVDDWSTLSPATARLVEIMRPRELS